MRTVCVESGDNKADVVETGNLIRMNELKRSVVLVIWRKGSRG